MVPRGSTRSHVGAPPYLALLTRLDRSHSQAAVGDVSESGGCLQCWVRVGPESWSGKLLWPESVGLSGNESRPRIVHRALGKSEAAIWFLSLHGEDNAPSRCWVGLLTPSELPGARRVT